MQWTACAPAARSAASAARMVAPVVTTSSTTRTAPRTRRRASKAGPSKRSARVRLVCGGRVIGPAEQAAAGHTEAPRHGPGQHLGLVVAPLPAPHRCCGRPRHHVHLVAPRPPGHGRGQRPRHRLGVPVLQRQQDPPARPLIGQHGVDHRHGWRRRRHQRHRAGRTWRPTRAPAGGTSGGEQHTTGLPKGCRRVAGPEGRLRARQRPPATRGNVSSGSAPPCTDRSGRCRGTRPDRRSGW